MSRCTYRWVVRHSGLDMNGQVIEYLPTHPWPSDWERTYEKNFDSLEDLGPEDLKLLGQKTSFIRPAQQFWTGATVSEIGPTSEKEECEGELILEREGGGRWRRAWVNVSCRLPERFEEGEWDGYDPDNWHARNGANDIRIPNRFQAELTKWQKRGFR